MATEKSMEIRARRTLARRGFALQKSRRRDPHALDYETYWIFDPDTDALVFPTGDNASDFGATLDEILTWIDEPPASAKKSKSKRKVGRA